MLAADTQAKHARRDALEQRRAGELAYRPRRLLHRTGERGKMTKDLAILIGPEQAWMTTEQFFEAIRVNLEAAMASA